MQGCVFCTEKFRSPENTLFEDDLCIAVPDDYPISKGHILVVPKRHYADMLEAPDEVVERVFAVAKMFGLRLKNRLGASSLKVITNVGAGAGQSVFHFHVHVIPLYDAAAGKSGRLLDKREFARLKSD